MKTFINRYATPLTTGLFAVSTVSGVALFFHWAPGAFHGMHEWLSMVLLLPFALHMWKNWNSLVTYAKRKSLWLPLLLSLVVALPFAASAFNGKPGGNPAFLAMQLVSQARLADTAPLFKMSTEELIGRLKQRGLTVNSADDTFGKIAASAGMPPAQLVAELMKKPNRP